MIEAYTNPEEACLPPSVPPARVENPGTPPVCPHPCYWFVFHK